MQLDRCFITRRFPPEKRLMKRLKQERMLPRAAFPRCRYSASIHSATNTKIRAACALSAYAHQEDEEMPQKWWVSVAMHASINSENYICQPPLEVAELRPRRRKADCPSIHPDPARPAHPAHPAQDSGVSNGQSYRHTPQ